MHLKEPEIFLGSRVTCFCREPSHHIKTPTCIFYKEVYVQKWYRKGLLIAFEEFPNKYLQVSHQGFSPIMWCHEHDPQEPWRSRWPQERDAEQSAQTHACHTHYAYRRLGTTDNQRYDVPRDWLWGSCQTAAVGLWPQARDTAQSKRKRHADSVLRRSDYYRR